MRCLKTPFFPSYQMYVPYVMDAMASGLDVDACGPFTPYCCCPCCCDALAAWQCEAMCASSQQLRNPGHCITSMPGPSRVGLTLCNRGLQGPEPAHSGCICRRTRAGGCGPASSRGTSSCASASRPGSAQAQRHLPACLLPPGLSMRRIRYAADCSRVCTCGCLQADSMQRPVVSCCSAMTSLDCMQHGLGPEPCCKHQTA